MRLVPDSSSTTVVASTRRGIARVEHVLTAPSTLDTATDATSFTQPSSWIWGHDKVHSPTLPAGDCVFRCWTHNPTQLHCFCHGTARQV